MGRLSAKFDYEEIRNARILQNRAKLASLGLHKTLSDLRSVASSPKSVKLYVRKPSRIDYSCMPLRRSSRLMKVSTTQSPSGHDTLRRSDRLKGIFRGLTSLPHEMEEVRANKNWMCPHCIEEKGIKPNWICNSSLCLKKRRMVPTGIATYRAREMGYESVAHLLMDELSSRR